MERLLAKEKPVIDESTDSCRCAIESCGSRANDRNRPELLVKEVCGLGHDQVGLQSVPREGFRIRLPLGTLEVRKRHRRIVHLVEIRQWSCIAGLVLPSLKVHGLARANAQQDSQNFKIGYVLRQGWVEAAATLLDERKVKSRRKGDRFEVVGEGRLRGVLEVNVASGRVIVASGDCCMPSHVQTRNRLSKLGKRVEIGICYATIY